MNASVGSARFFPGVAALYVSTRGPYTRLVGEWWDEERNALQYQGPLPVVAHPPCGPWSKVVALDDTEIAAVTCATCDRGYA